MSVVPGETQASDVVRAILAGPEVMDLVRVLALDPALGGFTTDRQVQQGGESIRQAEPATHRRDSILVRIEEVGRRKDVALASEIVACGIRELRPVLVLLVLGPDEAVDLVAHAIGLEPRHAPADEADEAGLLKVVAQNHLVAEGLVLVQVSDVTIEPVGGGLAPPQRLVAHSNLAASQVLALARIPDGRLPPA